MRLTYLSVLPLFVVSLLACKPSPPPMQIGLTQQVCDGSLYLASYLQFWSPSDAGVQIYADDSHTYAAFKEGRVDAASLYPHEVLTLWSENIPATIVLVLEVSNGADTLVAQSSISTLRDLRGKTIAIGNNPNNLYLLHRAIESVALSNDDVNTVTFTPDKHNTDFAKGDVHAISAKRNHVEDLLSTGGNELFSSRNIPGEIVQVLAINPDYLEKHPQRVNALINNWFSAMSYIETNPISATKQIAKWLNVEPEDIYEELAETQLTNKDDNIRMLVGDGASLHVTLNKLSSTMLEHDLLPHSPPTEHMINDSFVR